MQQNINRNNANIAQAAKVIHHFPPTNKDFSCTELHTPDGIYSLLHETFYETIAPQYTTGTRAFIVCVKEDSPATRITRNDSIQFSNNNNTFDSSDDDNNNGLSASFSMTPVIKSAALPIPNAASRKHIRTALTTSSSSTSIGSVSNTSGLHIVTSPQKLMTATANGNNTSPYLPHSPSFPTNLTPTTPTHILPPNHSQQQFATGSYMMSSSQDLGNGINTNGVLPMKDDYLLSSSYNGNSASVGSLSSLFGRSASNYNGSKSTSQLSTSSRKNNILSTSASSKPKNHLSNTNSTFVLRFLIHENLQKIISSKSLEDRFLFFNIGSSFIWVDAKNTPKVKI